MNHFNVGWYLIYTRPRHEKKVHARLSELKINSFLPTRKILRNWHDRQKFVEEPLFPSYIFIYLEDLENYYTARDTEGSLYYVKTGKNIARVNEATINNIRLTSTQGSDLEVSDTRFLPGQTRTISEGPLTGLTCEVIQHRGRARLLVRVELLQRSLLLNLPAQHLVNI